MIFYFYLVCLLCVLVCSFLGLSCLGLCASWAWLTIAFPMLGKFSAINLFKYFLRSFLSLFSFWDPYNANVGEFNVVPEVSWASLVAQLVKNPPAMRETWVQFLGWEDPLEKGKATHSSILAWRIPWTL